MRPMVRDGKWRAHWIKDKHFLQKIPQEMDPVLFMFELVKAFFQNEALYWREKEYWQRSKIFRPNVNVLSENVLFLW